MDQNLEHKAPRSGTGKHVLPLRTHRQVEYLVKTFIKAVAVG